MGTILNLVNATRAANGLSPILIEADYVKDVDFPKFSFPTFGASGVPPDPLSDEFRALYAIQKDVYRCVWVIGTSVAQLPKKVIQTLQGGEEIDVSHLPEFDVVLRNQNQWQTEYDFWESTSGFLELEGECPWALVLNGAKVEEIIPLRPDKIDVIPSTTDLVSHYQFDNNGLKFTIDVDEMVFLKYYNPNSDFRGLSPLRAAARNIEQDLRATKANIALLKNGGNPSGVVSMKEGPTDPDVWTRFKNDFRSQYQGETKRGKIMLLRSGIDWKQMGLSNEDMQFIEMLQLAGDSVGEVYGVPPLLLMKLRDSGVLANTEAQMKIFWDPTMKGKTSKLASMITKYLLPRLSNLPNLKFVFDLSGVLALQPDREQRMKEYETAVKVGAASPDDYSVNILGVPALETPESEARYILQGLIPLELAGPVALPEAPKEAGLSETIDNILKHNDLLPTVSSTDLMPFMDEVKDVRERRWIDMHYIKGINSLDRIRRIQGEGMRKVLARLFQEQSTEIQMALNSLKMFWNKQNIDSFDVTAVNLNVDEWVQRFEDEGKPFIASALRDAGKDLANSVGGTYDVLGDPNAAQFINTQSRRYALSVNKTTFIDVDLILRGAISEGLEIADVTNLINDYFIGKSKNHAKLVARTEIVGAGNKGRTLSMKSNNFERHMWLTERDERVRDQHVGLDGEVVRIDNAFSNGDTYPQSINERCFTIPVRAAA